MILANDLAERAGAQAIGQRARGRCARGFGWRGGAEQVGGLGGTGWHGEKIGPRGTEANPAAANFAALREVATTIDRLLSERRPVIAETVLANLPYRWVCEDAQRRDIMVRPAFVGIPTVEDAIRRLSLRAAKRGHDVSKADIRHRWPRTHENPAWFAQHADAVDVFANTWNAQPTLVARARAGEVTLFDAATLPAVTQVLRPLVRSAT